MLERRKHVAARVDAATVERLDALIRDLPPDLIERVEGSRSDVIRALVMRGLPMVEARGWEQVAAPRAKVLRAKGGGR